MIKILSGFVMVLFGAISTLAEGTNLFNAKEFALETFATYSAKNPKKSLDNGNYGGGVGISYFLYRNLGVAVDTYLENISGSTIDNLSGSFILRLPIETLRTAPYALAGLGYNFEVDQYSYHAGAGLELRLRKKIGLFVDARYVLNDKIEDNLLVRSGLKFVF